MAFEEQLLNDYIEQSSLVLLYDILNNLSISIYYFFDKYILYGEDLKISYS